MRQGMKTTADEAGFLAADFSEGVGPTQRIYRRTDRRTFDRMRVTGTQLRPDATPTAWARVQVPSTPVCGQWLCSTVTHNKKWEMT